MTLEAANNLHYPIQRPSHHPMLLPLRLSQRFSEMVYQTMGGYLDSLSPQMNQDPFSETKKKCIPESIDHLPMEQRSLVRIENSYFICIPFTLEKRDWPSFTDSTMHNLIVDEDGTLMQLLFAGTPSSSLPPGQQLMQAMEYKIGWKAVGRKFNRYI